MVYQLGRGVGTVFVDQGERRRPHQIIVDSESATKIHDKSGFSGPHFAVECKDGVIAHQLHKAACCLRKSRFIGDFDKMFCHISDFYRFILPSV